MSNDNGKQKYTPEFKIKVIEDLINNNLGFGEVARKHNMYVNSDGFKRNGKSISGGVTTTVKRWYDIYIAAGPSGFYHRGHGGYRQNNYLVRTALQHDREKDDVIAENRRLRMENDYLKKLDALVREREQPEKKN